MCVGAHIQACRDCNQAEVSINHYILLFQCHRILFYITILVVVFTELKQCKFQWFYHMTRAIVHCDCVS